MSRKHPPPYLMGVDVGTGSVRTALYDSSGAPVAEARFGFDNRFLPGGGVEQSPAEWREGMARTIRDCIASSGIDANDIRGVGVDGTSGTVAAIGRDGEPLAPALLWMDSRSSREMDDINATGDPALYWCGGKTSSEWVVAKILWLKRNRPELYSTAWMFMEPPDYLAHLLTGAVATSYSNAVHKRHYVGREGGWPEGLLDRIGLGDLMDKWPTTLFRAWEPVGAVTREAASEYGLPEGIPVVNAGVDGPAAMIGLGVVEPGDVAVTLGTSTCLLLFHESDRAIPGFWGPFPGGVFPQYNLYDVGQVSTGSIIEWYRKLLFDGFGRQFKPEQFAALESAAAALPPGALGASALDYWQGNRTPHADPRIRGAMWGLSLEHGPEHLYRAILEATAFGVRQVFDMLDENGVTTKAIVAGGGGSRNPLWMRIHADILERPIAITQTPEACALGCAMGAAVAAGIHADLTAAVSAMVSRTIATMPTADSFIPYRDAYERYRAAYDTVKSL